MLLFEKVRVSCNSWSIKGQNFNPELLNKIPLESTKDNRAKGAIDVLIPTIGKKRLHVRCSNNLASQTYLPKNVIVIEQNQTQTVNLIRFYSN